MLLLTEKKKVFKLNIEHHSNSISDNYFVDSAVNCKKNE